jgi:hypothetical protein
MSPQNGNGSRTEAPLLTASERRIIEVVTARLVRIMDERLAVQRRLLEERLMQRIDERFTSLREHVDEAIMEAEDTMLGEGPDEDDEDEDEFDDAPKRR